MTRRRQLERRRQLVGAMERDDHATTGSLLDRPGETMTWWHKWQSDGNLSGQAGFKSQDGLRLFFSSELLSI